MAGRTFFGFALALLVLAFTASASLAASPSPGVLTNPFSSSPLVLTAGDSTGRTVTFMNGDKSVSTTALVVTLTGTGFSKVADGCSGVALGPRKSCSVRVAYPGPVPLAQQNASLTVASKNRASSSTALLTVLSGSGVSGKKWNDKNVNGLVDGSDEGLGGWTIFVDYDNDGVLDNNRDATFVNDNDGTVEAGEEEPYNVTSPGPPGDPRPLGTYLISNLQPGTWNVREVAQQNWSCTAPNVPDANGAPDPPACAHRDTMTGQEIKNNDFLNTQGADLALTKTVDDPTPNVDDVVTFTVTLSNNGPNAATDVTVTDQLPNGLTFASSTTSQGSYNNVSGIWTVGTLASGATATLMISERVDSAASSTNTATGEADQFDPNPANNTDSATVTPKTVNQAPVANDDSYTVNEDGSLVVSAPAGVLANDTDADNDSLTAIHVSGPTNGSLTLNPDGSFSYSPNANFSGVDGFLYKANDGLADSNIATVTIIVVAVNDPPVANPDRFGPIPEDDPFNASGNTIFLTSILANDYDADNDRLTVSACFNPLVGDPPGWSVQQTSPCIFLLGQQARGPTATVTVSPNGSILIADPSHALDALNFGENLTLQFGYLVSDGHGAGPSSSSSATIIIAGQAEGG